MCGGRGGRGGGCAGLVVVGVIRGEGRCVSGWFLWGREGE